MLKKILNISQYSDYITLLWGRLYIKNILRLHGITISSKGRFFGLPIVSLTVGSRIIIGDNCVLCSSSYRTALGINHPVILRTLTKDANIIIGNDVGISGGSICAAKLIKIGNDCLIGANVTIADTDFHPIKSVKKRYTIPPSETPSAPVIIEENVFIGTGAIILKGVTIGRNSVVGAGSIVTKNIPPNCVVAGNPAIIIKKL